jgi:hypothetical protein
MIRIGPAPERSGQFTVKLTLEDKNGNQRDLSVPLMVYDTQIVEVPAPWEIGSAIEKHNDYHVELASEGPALVQGGPSRVWFRVTEKDGSPARGVVVKWSASGAEPSAGSISTDAGGLGYVVVTPHNLMTKFVLHASSAVGDAHLVQSLRPLGRSCMLWLDRVLQAAGETAIQVSAKRSNPEDDLYCDLYRGDAWIRSWHFPANPGGELKSKFTVDLPDADTFRLQCYNHYATAGAGADVVWLFRRNQPRERAISELLRGAPTKSTSRNARYRRSLPITGKAGQNAMMALFRSHHVLPSDPTLVASTRKSDIERANQANESARATFFLLIGASFGLVLLWAVYTAIQTAIQNRSSMAQAIEELGELAVTVPPPTLLIRARTTIQAVFVVVVLVFNIIAMLTLFQYI